MESIYSFEDYKAYLKYRISLEKRSRGNQRLLCEAAGLQPSFLSRVLHGSLHLTPEHAIGMTKFWGLNPLDAQYFHELVHYARAGTPLLRSYLRENIVELKAKSSQVSNRLTIPALTEERVQTFYYSSWLVSAIHVLVSVPGFDTTETIAKRLAVPASTVVSILAQLREFGLVDERDARWRVGHYSIHLPRHSPLQQHHQANWKLRAIANQETDPHSLHYCNVHSISAADFVRLREELLKLITTANRVIHESPPEKLACVNIDYFEP